MPQAQLDNESKRCNRTHLLPLSRTPHSRCRKLLSGHAKVGCPQREYQAFNPIFGGHCRSVSQWSIQGCADLMEGAFCLLSWVSPVLLCKAEEPLGAGQLAEVELAPVITLWECADFERVEW